MEGWDAHFPRLDARTHLNLTLNASAARTDESWTGQNATRTLISSLRLQQVQTLRTMHLTIGAFSLALALLTVHRIISDARRAVALQVNLRKKRFNWLQSVHTAETFPLALACGVVLQQTTFVAVQSTSLHSVLSDQCRGLAMATFPAIFIVGYITLIFGIEMAFRSIKKDRFAPRGKWNTIACIAVVSFLLLLTWMPTVVWPSFSRCVGSLIWFPMRYDFLTLIILCVLVFLLLSLAAFISIQLMRTPDVDHNERIAASRMTYYLLIVALIYTLVIPVEVQSLRRSFMDAMATARVAEISLFATGLITTFFHLFLRTNATRMVIRHIEDMRAPQEQARPKIRFFGPSDLEMNISGPLSLQGGRRAESRQGLIDVGPEKNRSDFDDDYFLRPERAITPNSLKGQQSPIDLTKWPLPPDSPDVVPAQVANDRGTRGYSLFPTRAEEVPRLPATVYNPNGSQGDSRISKLALRRFTRRGSVTNVSEAFDFLTKPRPLFSEKHRRDRSTDSSATVQIGLRFSVAPATLAAAKCTQAEQDAQPAESGVPALKRGEIESSGETIGLSIQAPSSSNTTPDEVASPSQFPSPPTPARAKTPSPARTPAFPITPSQNSSAYLQAQREKVLPAVPARAPESKQVEELVTLAPTTFSGLRMNPVTPATTVASPITASTPTSPTSINLARSNSGGRNVPSPTARIPLGAGTMSRSPPPNGWI